MVSQFQPTTTAAFNRFGFRCIYSCRMRHLTRLRSVLILGVDMKPA
jgi:hypothetical protein